MYWLVWGFGLLKKSQKPGAATCSVEKAWIPIWTQPSLIVSRNLLKCGSLELTPKFFWQDVSDFAVKCTSFTRVTACSQPTQERWVGFVHTWAAHHPNHLNTSEIFLWHSFSLQHWGESSCFPPTNYLREGKGISHRQEKRALEAVCTQTISQK